MAEEALGSTAVYSSRPTIRIDNLEVVKASELLIGMSLLEQEGGMSSLELRFSNIASDPEGGADFAFEEESEFQLGSRISVYSGDETEPQEIFSGNITGLEAEFPKVAPPEIIVLAEDDLQKARMTRRTETYRDVSLSDVLTTVASRISVTPVINGFTDTVGTWVQFNESDLAFLRRLIQRYDGDMQMVGNELHVSPRNDVQRGSLELELYSQLRSVKFIADLSDQVGEVTVSGWDALRGRRVKATSTGAHPGPGSGRKGSQILKQTLGERTEHVGHVLVTTDSEATALADTVFDQRARRFVCAEGTVEGNPALRVGTEVRLTGMSPRFENTYYVVSAHHRFNVLEGYETDFKAECHALGDA